LVSPAARKLAAELGVDYRSIKGTGGRGRIERADVLAAADVMKRGPLEIVAASSAPLSAVTPTTDRIVPMTGVRARIAERMSQSAQSTARVTLIAEADATQLVGWREQLRRDFPQQAGAIGYNELFVVIAANALRAFPYMNATLRENGIHLLNEINVAVAVDTERGLLAPVIRQADQKSAIQIHQEFARLAELTRSGRIGPDDLSGSTFTITNLGMYEIDTFTPLINLPELAILGVGQVAARPVAVDDRVVVQKRVALSLSFDHRLVDGAPAARFLQRIKHLVEAPYALIPG
ncbi:MAG: 2-oxo acid dehydrogenase subunit E2, partial [Chloroflexi bacterium]|nr:2-oxo acid dehydrogenase subunit E2 [Chloroflexota bacterium]